MYLALEDELEGECALAGEVGVAFGVVNAGLQHPRLVEDIGTCGLLLFETRISQEMDETARTHQMSISTLWWRKAFLTLPRAFSPSSWWLVWVWLGPFSSYPDLLLHGSDPGDSLHCRPHGPDPQAGRGGARGGRNAHVSLFRTKTTQASLSCCCALDAVIRNDSRLQRCAPAAQLGCSSNVPTPVPTDCPQDSRDLSAIKAAARDTSVGTRLSGYTAIFVFFPVLSVSPDFTLHSLNDSGQIRYHSGRFSILYWLKVVTVEVNVAVAEPHLSRVGRIQACDPGFVPARKPNASEISNSSCSKDTTPLRFNSTCTLTAGADDGDQMGPLGTLLCMSGVEKRQVRSRRG
ncbi:hypothetical protein INR49_023537 [Caranx melampygus]|nr:hypothetical protein INR49_023537 [Caranx melampygus]